MICVCPQVWDSLHRVGYKLADLSVPEHLWRDSRYSMGGISGSWSNWKSDSRPAADGPGLAGQARRAIPVNFSKRMQNVCLLAPRDDFLCKLKESLYIAQRQEGPGGG